MLPSALIYMRAAEEDAGATMTIVGLSIDQTQLREFSVKQTPAEICVRLDVIAKKIASEHERAMEEGPRFVPRGL